MVSGWKFATDHAAERAIQRYGFCPSPIEWGQAVLDILATLEGNGPALLLGRSRYVERWAVSIAGTACVVVYRPAVALIVTVLPATAPKGLRRGDYNRQRLPGRVRRERALVEEWV